jgi:hypothetical protein
MKSITQTVIFILSEKDKFTGANNCRQQSKVRIIKLP